MGVRGVIAGTTNRDFTNMYLHNHNPSVVLTTIAASAGHRSARCQQGAAV